MKTVKIVTIAHAMEKRQYLYYLIRIKKLSVICDELKKNYDPTCLNSHDDRATFTQLDTNLISLHTKVKFWKMDQKLFVPVESKKSSKDSIPKKSKAEIHEEEQQVEEDSSDKVSSEDEKMLSKLNPFIVLNQKFS